MGKSKLLLLQSENILCGLEDLFFLPCQHSKICGSKRMNTTSLVLALSTENASRRSKLIETPVFQRMDEVFGFSQYAFIHFSRSCLQGNQLGITEILRVCFWGRQCPRIKTTRFLHHFTQR